MDYLGILQRYDDEHRWEYPAGFDYDAATERFGKYAEALSIALGRPLENESGSYIQDASFHSQIYLPLGMERFGLIRFSNFGDMVTVSEEEPVPKELMEKITDLLMKHDYVYVPSSVLIERYTGKNPGVTGIKNWWTRYFDWV